MTENTANLLDAVPGLEYRAEFVPWSMSRNAGEKSPTLNWRVTFSTPRGSITADYSQGIGYLPGYQHGRKTVDSDAAERAAAESGKWGGYDRPAGYGRPLPGPDAAEVMHSLLSDAEAIDYPTCEEWADNFGFDRDSRKGEAIYRACLDVGLKLRAMLGDTTMTQLRELLQDL
jgi:hypothetical protein